jgi:hypothetical protein
MTQETPARGRFSLGLAVWFAPCALLALSLLSTAHFPPWVSWHAEVPAFAAVLLAAWIALGRALKSRAPAAVDFPVAAAPFLVFLALVAIQRATGLIHYDGDVWLVLFYTSLCVSCLALGAAATGVHAPNGLRDLAWWCRLLAWFILATCVLSVVIAVAQVFDLFEGSAWIVRMAQQRRPGANLAQSNQLATLLVMGAASVIYLWDRLGRVLRAALMLAMCAGVAITESRGGGLALVALFGWWILGRKSLPHPASPWQVGAFAFAFVAMYIAWPHVLDATQTVGYKVVPRELQEGDRFEVWRQLVEAARLHPWVGWGFHRGVAAHNAVLSGLTGSTVSEPYSYSHNLLLDLVIWFGAPTAVLLSAAAALYLWVRIRRAATAPAWYGLAFAMPMLLHSMVEFPFAYAYFLAPVMFLLGATEASTGGRRLLRVPTKVAVVPLVLVTCAMAWSVLEYTEAEEDFRVARFESMRIGSTPADYSTPTLSMFDQLQLVIDDARITPTRNMSARDMHVVQEAALYYPWLATQSRYALALALNGDPLAAARQMNVVRAMWGDKVYAEMKGKIAELAATKYPELQQLRLP